MPKIRTSFFILLIVGMSGLMPTRAQDLSVIKGWMHYTDASNALYHNLSSQAFQYLSRRSRAVDTLNTPADWRRRQKDVRRKLLNMVGPFPQKTPLNARVVDTLHKVGYRVEKLIYESQPNNYITAALFLPDGLQEKNPAILYCSGHVPEAFRSVTYQRVILNLVNKGFIVLAFDPVGQGERLQYFSSKMGRSRLVGYTDASSWMNNHSYAGDQAFISKGSLARFMIWDGIRAIDYLTSRQEVDSNRIGVTGRSGGGTQSAYIAAFDERVRAVATENYITSFRRLLESRIGPQDAEQNFYHGIAQGIDHADLLEVRVPKPALIIATTRDAFSIQGTRETYAEVKQAYEMFGKPQNIALASDDAPHASTRENREALYRFFQKYLDHPGSSKDEKVAYLSSKELQITETGQVASSLGGETVFSLNKAGTQKLLAELGQSRKDLPHHLRSVKQSAKKLSGYKAPQKMPEAIFAGRYQREGYAIEKYIIRGEGNYPIPFLMMVPEKKKALHPAIIYLHPDGKAANMKKMEWFAEQGYVVVAPDLLGVGEMGGGVFSEEPGFEGKFYTLWLGSVLIGRSITGIRAGDTIRLVRFLENQANVNSEKIDAIAYGEMTPVLLHAAAFDTSISKIALVNPLISYRSLVMHKYYDPRFVSTTVAGALAAYDLPDLAASLAPRKLLMVNVTDEDGRRAGEKLIEKDLSVVDSSYSVAEASSKLEIRTWEAYEKVGDIFSSWLK